MRSRVTVAALAASLGLSAALAQTPRPPLSAAESDPVRMGWMVGSPPPPDKLVRFADGTHYHFPQTRWSFANFRTLVPTSNIWRGAGPVAALPRAERADIDAVTFQPLGRSDTMTWAQSLEANYTDAIVVLHRGFAGQHDRAVDAIYKQGLDNSSRSGLLQPAVIGRDFQQFIDTHPEGIR